MDVQELVVRAVPEGVSDTVDGLGEMTDQVEDSTDEMDEQASSMADLSKEFSGAMDVAVAGLAVASGFLLSRVPVLGGAFDALFAIVDAVAFQMDSVLRPVLSPLTDAFLYVADKIFQAEGAGGALIGMLGTLVTILGAVVLPAAALASKLGLAVSTKAALISAGQALIGALATVASALSLPFVAVGLLIAGLALLAWHFREGIVDAVHTAIDHLGNLAEWFTNAASDAVDWGVDLIGGWIDGITSVELQDAVDFVTGLADTFTDLVSDAWGWGRDLIQRLIAGIKSRAGDLRESIGGMEVAAGVTVDDISGTIGDIGESASEAGGDFIGSVGGGRGTINLDGRSIENTQGRYRADNLHRRGG